MTRPISVIFFVLSTILLLTTAPASDAVLPSSQSAESTSSWQSIAYLAYGGTDRHKLAQASAPASSPRRSPVSASPPPAASHPTQLTHSPPPARHPPPGHVAPPVTAPGSKSPHGSPSKAPSKSPSKGPTNAPANAPGKAPSNSPSKAPAGAPRRAPHPPIAIATPTPPAPVVPTFGTPPAPPLVTTPPAAIITSAPPPVAGFQAINTTSTSQPSAAGSNRHLDVHLLLACAAAFLGAAVTFAA